MATSVNRNENPLFLKLLQLIARVAAGGYLRTLFRWPDQPGITGETKRLPALADHQIQPWSRGSSLK